MRAELSKNWIITFEDITKSTNDDALNFVMQQNQDKKFVFCAERQTGGRGRLGRKWSDGEGNLMFSAIVPCRIENTGRLSVAAGISVLQAVKSFDDSANLQLKWPNDVFLNGKKVCGILIERKDENYAVVGVGINIKNAPKLENNPYQATSLKENDILPEKEEVLYRFLEIFDVWLEKIEKKEFNAIRETWIKYAKGINKKVEIVNLKEKTEGVLVGIDESGALIVESGGKQTTVLTGDVNYL